MRLERLTLRNVGPFADATIDLTTLPEDARLIAITGENGAGKSTLLGCWPGALYRQAPRIPNLTSIATARDALIEAHVVNGAPWTFRLMLDGVSRKSEALILDAEGAAVLDSTKVRDVDRWVASHIMPPEVFYASLFGAQGSGGFIEAKPADRKAILCRVLGIEHLEAVAERCRESARASKQSVATLEARLADEQQRGGDVDEARDALVAARTEARRAEAALTTARQQLAEVREMVEEHRELVAEHRRLTEQRSELERRRDAAQARVADIEPRVANNRRVLEQAAEIRQAAETVARLDREIAEADRRIADIAADNDRRADHARQLRIQLDEARRQEGGARIRVEACDHRLADRERIEAAVARVPALKLAALDSSKVLADAEAALASATGQQLATAEDRIDHLRGGLGLISAGDAGADHAARVLEEDDCAVVDAQAAPGRIRRLREECERAASMLDTARNDLLDAQATAARADDLDRAATEREQAVAEAEEHRQAAADLESQLAQVAAAQDDDEIRTARQVLVNERERLAPLAAKAQPLGQAEARLEELEPQLAAARREADEATAQLAGMAPLATLVPPPDVDDAQRAADEAERAARAAEAQVPLLEQALARAEESEGRVREMDRELAAERERLADWTRLAADVGRDGLQALEIDAAGPELTDIVNDLLHASHGARWSVKVETTRLSSDGKRELEGLEITVLDTEAGREAPAQEFSGGERVFLNEAVSLGLSVLACRRAGIESPTLARDESGAALDAANGRRYIAMLRRAADMVGARHVLYVSHTPELQELADARIEIRGGAVAIQ